MPSNPLVSYDIPLMPLSPQNQKMLHSKILEALVEIVFGPNMHRIPILAIALVDWVGETLTIACSASEARLADG